MNSISSDVLEHPVALGWISLENSGGVLLLIHVSSKSLKKEKKESTLYLQTRPDVEVE